MASLCREVLGGRTPLARRWTMVRGRERSWGKGKERKISFGLSLAFILPEFEDWGRGGREELI